MHFRGGDSVPTLEVMEHVLTVTDSCQPMSALALTTHHERDEGAMEDTKEPSLTVCTSIKSSCHDPSPPPGQKISYKAPTDKPMTAINLWRWRGRCYFGGGGHEQWWRWPHAVPADPSCLPSTAAKYMAPRVIILPGELLARLATERHIRIDGGLDWVGLEPIL